MKFKGRQKKAILMLYTYIIMLFSPKIHETQKINYNQEYSITSNTLYASFNGIDVHIEDSISSANQTSSSNIYIFDDRSNKNPDMVICDSFKVISINDMIKILKIIESYEKEYPSKWHRSIKSMLIEWLVHNICYYINVEQNRTKEVNLDNAEEEKYAVIFETFLHYCKELTTTTSKKLTKK